MGDRVSVQLVVRVLDKPLIDALLDASGEGYFDVSDTLTQDGGIATIELSFEEVNYSNLEVEKALQKNKIPYDKYWASGSEFEAGSEFHRINSEMLSVVHQVNAGAAGMVELSEVIKAFEAGTIESFIAEKNSGAPLSWLQQESILSNQLVECSEVKEVQEVGLLEVQAK
jgi:hypothetical protein